mmetsp:Transcript_54188/g.117082  ORF Transcript_54188/g.117082 Transcript_54188/m.117082 type:complete len:207 (-) Transcript_54188:193-813(-)
MGGAIAMSTEMSANSYRIQAMMTVVRSTAFSRTSSSSGESEPFTMYSLSLQSLETALAVSRSPVAARVKVALKRGMVLAPVRSSVRISRRSAICLLQGATSRSISMRWVSPWVSLSAAMALMSEKWWSSLVRHMLMRLYLALASSVSCWLALFIDTQAKAMICEYASAHLLYMKCSCVTASQYLPQPRLVRKTTAKPTMTPNACIA